MADIELNTISSGYNISKVNDNFETIEDELNNNVMKTDGSQVMTDYIDMNSNRIVNLTDGVDLQDAVTVNQVSKYLLTTEGYASDAYATLVEFRTYYLGAFSTEPTTDNEGNTLYNGAIYFNLDTDRFYVWNEVEDEWQDLRGTGTLYYKPASTTLSNFEVWCADSSDGAVSRDLPSDPENGVEVTIRDDTGYAGTNTITIGRNGNTIMGIEEDLEITTNWSWVRLKWRSGDSDWRVIGGGVGAHVAFSGEDMLKLVYPVGSVYISTSSTNPEYTLSFGTWEAIGAGKVIAGVGTAEDINGVSKTITSGNNIGEWEHTQTEGELAAHTHTIADLGGNGEDENNKWPSASDNNTQYGWDYEVGSAGSSSAMNISNPMFGVYLWERIS